MASQEANLKMSAGEADRPKWQAWVGRVLSAIPVLLFLASATMKFTHGPAVVETFVGKLGYPEESLTAIGILELLCVVVYVIPQTAVLGAVLLAAYLGGAVATHVRVHDPFIVPALLGVFVWAGLYLRDDRLRALLPLRKA
jgi:DoxX-like family